MGNSFYVDYSQDAPLEFKQIFTQQYKWYVITAKITSCVIPIGFLLAGACGALQKILEKTYPEETLQAVFSTSVPVIVTILGIISGISKLIKNSQEKSVDNLLKYVNFFNRKPDTNQETMQGATEHDVLFLQITPLPQIKLDQYVDALKFQYHK